MTESAKRDVFAAARTLTRRLASLGPTAELAAREKAAHEAAQRVAERFAEKRRKLLADAPEEVRRLVIAAGAVPVDAAIVPGETDETDTDIATEADAEPQLSPRLTADVPPAPPGSIVEVPERKTGSARR